MIVSAWASVSDVSVGRGRDAEVWRRVRRFNPPVQLAVMAAMEVASRARGPGDAQLISIAPCQSGSAELTRWVEELPLEPDDAACRLRVNPTHTLHAVDNLALSSVAIQLLNHGAGVGLGGSAGQVWEGLDIALTSGSEEVLLFAGDQLSSRGGPALGVAVLLARTGPGSIVFDTIVRRRATAASKPTPHSAAGLAAMLGVLHAAPPGRFVYEVPAAHGDGLDFIEVRGEIRC